MTPGREQFDPSGRIESPFLGVARSGEGGQRCAQRYGRDGGNRGRSRRWNSLRNAGTPSGSVSCTEFICLSLKSRHNLRTQASQEMQDALGG